MTNLINQDLLELALFPVLLWSIRICSQKGKPLLVAWSAIFIGLLSASLLDQGFYIFGLNTPCRYAILGPDVTWKEAVQICPSALLCRAADIGLDVLMLSILSIGLWRLYRAFAPAKYKLHNLLVSVDVNQDAAFGAFSASLGLCHFWYKLFVFSTL